MASRILDVLNQKGTHAVGNISDWTVKTLNQGALVDDNAIDNFTFVELGFNAEGERICKQLTAVAKESYLIASVERRLPEESLSDFYNAKGERARIIIPEQGRRFDSSAYALNAGVTEIKNGFVAHFDPTTKKYIISDSATPHADYATANKKLLVVATEDETVLIDGREVVRFEVQ